MLKNLNETKGLTRILMMVFFLILGLLPIHALISVWLTSNFGYEQIWQSWKEILLFFSFPLTALLLFKQPDIAKKIYSRRINQLILLYGLLHLFLWAFKLPEIDAAIAGIIFNLRFLAMFVLAQILIEYFSFNNSHFPLEKQQKAAEVLTETTLKIVTVGGLVVVLFGALQVLVLPDDFLSHFGYGPETIEPYRTIDQNSDFVRINSTLRGPNPLGLYLVLVLPLILATSNFSFLISRFSFKQNFVDKFSNIWWAKIAIGVAGVVTLYGTFSRSGWLGTIVAIAVLLWLTLRYKQKKRLLIIGGVASMVGILLLALSWQSDFVQNTILHQDPGQGVSINSTEAHWRSNQKAGEDIIDNPIGGGPGSAGPASYYTSPTKISESYFLQIGQELGVIGLGLFLGISYLAGRSLWQQKDSLLPRVLLASFIGVTVASFFLHTWANEVIAMTWWGLAGLYYK